MIPVALWFLATLDAAFAGYRAAAGRNALINKRRYFERAMLRGALFGQIAVGISLVVILLILSVHPQPASLIENLMTAGMKMLLVYLPCAFLILIGFGLRSFPSVDIRSITSTLIFGPFTLIRPFVALAGVIYAVATVRTWTVAGLGLLVLILMLSIEQVLTLIPPRSAEGE